MAEKHKLAELQLAIMHVLWEQGAATVAEVRKALAPQRRLAHTTVATMLAKLEVKGHVTRQSDGRVNVYRPKLRREQVTRTMVADLVQRLFAGDVAEMACHLVDAGDVSRESLARLKKLIRQKEEELKRGE
ncbi:MAG TPA: BlaI/MecI/CopY family transcriptional regulator [Pirellulales bacterium]|jgi:predicted transcriptional regulator|nr:BlaI/MecI/CopY family transcriptional regulator [Pirellulales bacterium]